MQRTIRQFVLIANATALEGLQQPICLLLALAGCVLSAFGPLLQLHVFGEEGRLARDSGLAYMLVLGLCVVGFTSGFTLDGELRRGTAAATLAKPVRPAVFLVAKWAGVVLIITLFCTIMSVATLLAERTSEHFVETASFAGSIVDRYSGLGALVAPAAALAIAAALNYFRKARFGTAAMFWLLLLHLILLAACGFIDRGGQWLPRFSLQVNPRALPAAFLIFLLLVLYSALATALSTRLRTGATLAICAILLFAGFMADRMLGAPTTPIAKLLYAVIPDVQHFWLADALANQGRIPLRYLAHATSYTAAITALYLGLGCLSLKTRDLA